MSKKLSDEDQAIWDNFTKGITPLKCDKVSKTIIKPTITKNFIAKREFILPQKNYEILQLSKRELKSLQIEKILDLHGLTEANAHLKTIEFLKNAYFQGIRWVLVITGKGTIIAPSILKKNFTGWLNEISSIIVGYAIAQPKDGGEGAYYVKVRKNKN